MCLFSKWASFSRADFTNCNHFSTFIFNHSQSSWIVCANIFHEELFNCSWWQKQNHRVNFSETTFFCCCFKILEDKRSNHLPRTVTWGVGGITWHWRVNPIILHLCPDSDRNGFPPKRKLFFSYPGLLHLPECPPTNPTSDSTISSNSKGGTCECTCAY